MNFDKNDPRLSAYILNELDTKDRAEIEQQIAANDELAAFVESLRQTQATLTVKLRTEAEPMGLSAAQRQTVLNQSAATKESLWGKINSWLASPKLILSASAVTCLLLVGIAISVFFSRPPKPVSADQLPKADMVAAGFEQPSLPVTSASTVVPPPPVDEGIAVPDVSMASTGMAGSATPSPGLTITSGPVGQSQLEPSNSPSFVVSAPASSAQVSTDGYINYDGPVVSGGVPSDSTVANLNPSVGSSASPSTVPPSTKSSSTSVTRRMTNAFGSQATDGYSGQDMRRRQSAMTKDQLPPPNTNESYLQKPENIWLLAAQEPLSTFSIDVDTASYSNIRRFLSQGQLPPPDAVRIEELLNYFTYDYPQPEGRQPFSVTTEIASCPWDSTHKLLRIGIKGREISDEERPRLSLVFLIDVSGSMDQPNKLPLVISGMKLLLQKLRPDDRVAIVTYAGESKLALKSTPIAEKDLIMSVIDSLRAGGSTNGEGGIRTAYRVARDNFIENGANRVILCTDGDFNVGNTGEESLAAMVQRQAKSGVFLNVYGFGMGNYKDSRLVQLADQGNGVYGYIDSYAEAQKIFSKQITGTLITIAKDVKIQMDFNPAKVGAYRLIGYEKRLLNKEDFKDDKKDAGEIGSGHTVTALYEIVPPGVAVSDRVDASKYTKQSETAKPALSAAANSEELGTVRLRYKLPKEDSSTPFNVAVSDRDLDYRKASVDFKLAAACAAFGMTLKDSPDRGDADLALALQLAKMGKGEDKDNYRAEFIRLIETAKELKQ